MNKLTALRLSILILLLAGPAFGWSQTIHIKGKVTNERSEPVAFAAIRTDKKGNLLLANEKGEFELNILSGSTIWIACGGYEEKQLVIKDQSNLSIQLELAAGIEGLENSSASLVKPGLSGRGLDSLYANDIIIQRDIQLPDSLNGFYVYPSAVSSGGNISLGIQLLETGDYEYRLVDASGKQQYSKEIRLDKIAKQFNLTLPVLASGDYRFLLISRSSGKIYQQMVKII
ncbi:MAG: carboxypeptidase-like regulatory domain-containing protein [Chitinophagaceae bacterium]|nr:carboxypeptidase-like regulatory domain-containing protein [Chitinophagaceae bacterium]